MGIGTESSSATAVTSVFFFVSHILSAVSDIFTSVSPVFNPVQWAALVLRISHILPAIPYIFSTISHILVAVSNVFTTVDAISLFPCDLSIGMGGEKS
jgi:phage-related protein